MIYLHRSTNAEQPHSINARRLSFPRWSRYLNQNISQKCSRDEHKMTLGVSMDVERSTVVELEHPWYQGVKLYTISRGVAHNSESQQRYLNCRDLENFFQENLRGGGGERHRGHRSVIYEGDASGAWEWRQIKLKTTCDVPAALNQRRTIVVGGSRSMFVPTLVSLP